MSKLEQLEKKMKQLRAEESVLSSDIQMERGRKRAACEHCKKSHELRRLIFIQTYWYVSPYGCTEGDYWNPGEGQYVCPSCLKINRMCSFNKLDWLMKYTNNFALIVECHDRRASMGGSRLIDDDEEKKFKAKWKELYNQEFQF